MTSTVMSANYVQADHTESIVMAAYTLAALGRYLAESKEDLFKW
jgi:hypothetical protein